mmetsp:Transcript_72936/g.152262  ORF Transcript_72936/g.152262 Transcript_72936/m.152262 type:complete len:467 (+) Transcript_72936:296-1696(+)
MFGGGKAKKLQEELDSSQKKLADREAKLKSAQDELDEQQAQLSAANEKLEAINAKLEEAQQLPKDLQQEMQKQKEETSKEIESIKAKLAESSEGAKHEAEKLSSDLAALEGQFKEAENRYKEAEEESKEVKMNHELAVNLSKECNMRAAALKRAGEEILELRRQVQLLRSENTSLAAQVDAEARLAEDVRVLPAPEELESLGGAELANRLHRTLEKYREEKAKGAELSRRLDEALKEVARGKDLKKALDELEDAHLDQNKEIQRLQEENHKMDNYRQTTRTQEKVIAKLEKVLEGSLEEVRKAQRVQVEVEKLKTENMRLREKCACMVARRPNGHNGGSNSGGFYSGELNPLELQKQLEAKVQEVARLQGLVKDLQRSASSRVEGGLASSSELAQDRARLEAAEAKRYEWEQRSQASESRLQVLQRQLEESGRRYGAELSSLRVDLAKRDARISELELMLQDGGQT